MKPLSEFSEVLIPPMEKMSTATTMGSVTGTPPYVFTNIIGNTKKPKATTFSKWFIAFIILAALGLTACTTFTILRYETKLNDYESRIGGLESQLDDFIEAFEIKTLIHSIQRHAHDGEDDDPVGPHHDSLEVDFSNDLMDRPPEMDSRMDRRLPTLPHHYRSISEMSDEDFAHFQNQFNGGESEEDDEDDSTEYFKTTTIVEGETLTKDNNDDDDMDRIEQDIVFGEIKMETPHILSRNRRQVRSEDGVPIREGSYVSNDGRRTSVPAPTPTESEGLRLYESMIATGGRGEPKAPEYLESDGSNIQPYHRTSAAWTERSSGPSRLELKSGDYGSYGSGPTLASDQFYMRGQSARPTLPTTYGAGSNAIHRQSWRSSSLESDRNSRGPTTEENNGQRRRNNRTRYNYPPLRKLGEGDGTVVARVHQDRGEPIGQAASGANYDDSLTSFAESRHYRNIQRKNSSGGYRARNSGGTFARQQQQPGSQRQRQVNEREEDYDDDGDDISSPQKDEFSFVKAEAWAEGPKTYAAHYVGDTTNYTTAHRHYEGNGRLKNADGIFSNWKAADWMNGNDASKEAFVLNANGAVTVKKEGIYYIYAQIHYLDEHDINGYLIQINSEPFVQCTTMTETHHTNSRKTKSNTCFTGGVTHVKENDRILIKDIETNRYSIFKPEKSFFGLTRIGAITSR